MSEITEKTMTNELNTEIKQEICVKNPKKIPACTKALKLEK